MANAPGGSRFRQFRSLKGPIVLFVVALVLVIALLVLWNVVLAIDYQRIRELTQREGAVFHWTFIAIGSVLFVVTISLLSIIGSWLIQEILYTRRLSSFVATFTHELNSPLASIKLFTQTLKRTSLEEADRDRFLDLILSDVERLRGRISNVLRTAQLDSPDGLRIHREPIDLGAFLEEYVARRQVGIEWVERKASLGLTVARDLWIEGDRPALQQVLDNLVDNALKYGRADGVAIQLGVEAVGDLEVVLEVRDDGAGIAEEHLEKIFDCFGRGPERRLPRQGTGLGLWIVRSIIDAHGGTIEASSPGLDRGATFRITLPRAEAPAPDAQPSAVVGELAVEGGAPEAGVAAT